MGMRRKARDVVLQSYYASLISGASLLDTLDDQLQRRESAPETAEFARDLATKVVANQAAMKSWLGRLCNKGWDPARLGVLERAILAIGLTELKCSPDVPYRVVINEALDLTHRYCDDNAVGFVNGVLDRAAREVYPEIAGKAPAAAPEPDPDAGKDEDEDKDEDGEPR